jgi:hypothetical protein
VELLVVVIAAAVLTGVSTALRAPVLLFAPAASLILVVPRFQPSTAVGALCRNAMLIMLAANVVVLIVMAASGFGDGLAVGLLWNFLVGPIVGTVVFALLAFASARGETALFMRAAGLALAMLVAPSAAFVLGAIAGR